MLSDKQLKQIDTKDFKEKVGITKTDYRFLRNLVLAGWRLDGLTIWSSNDKPLTLHQVCQVLRSLDVIYVTRLQKERK